MKRILIILAIMAMFSVISAVTWTVSLEDSYGDGWNGGALTVYVNGSPVLTGITLASGAGPVNYTFEVSNGDGVTTLYTAGSWSYENEYYIYDHNNLLVASQGEGGVTPSSITVPIIVVAGGPGIPTGPSPANGAGANLSSGTLSWTFGANTMTYDLWFGPTGSMSQVVTGAAAGLTGSYAYSGLTYLTQYSWQVICHNTTTRLTTNGPVWTFTALNIPGQILIGSGTSTGYLPINAYYGYSYSQTYYLAGEIGTAGMINSISYYWNGNAVNTLSNQWTVYMKHSTNNAFATNTSWESGLTQVFSGVVSCPASPGWVNITLNTPFLYDGTSNLVIGVYESLAGYDSPYGMFLQTTSATTRGMIYYNDSTNPDPLAPPTASGLYNLFPNLLMGILPTTFGEPAAPILTSPAEHASGVSILNVAYSWYPDLVNGEMPETYNLYIVDSALLPAPYTADDFFGLATYFEDVSSGSIPAFTYEYGHNYTWTVEAFTTGFDPAYAWPFFDFSTMADPTITTFPYLQNFEVWPPENWDLDDGSYEFGQYLDANGNNWAMANFWGQTAGNTDIMITPPILTTTNLKLSFLWSHLYHATYPNDALTIQISTDLSTWTDLWYKGMTDLNSGDGAGNTAPGTGVTATIQIPSAYNGSPFYLRFYGYSGYGPDLYIDNVMLSEVLAHDVMTTQIIHNEVYAPGVAAAPQAVVFNNGANTETFQVNMSTTGYNNTQIVTDLAPGASATVTFADITVAQNVVYPVTVTTMLGTDMYVGNDTANSTFICVNLNTQAYAEVAYDPTAALAGPASFNLASPWLITDLPGSSPATNFFSGGDWMDDHWYVAEWDDASLATDNYWKINHTTGGMANLGQMGVAIHGVAFNAGTNTLFGSSTTDLYTMNPATGLATLVGSFGIAGGTMIGLACDHANNILYGVDLVTDNLYTINQTTGAATAVGPLGIALNYAQGLGFDQQNGYLFLAGYTTLGTLYWINTSNGGAWKIGDFQNNAEMDALAIPYLSDVPQVSIAADGTISWTAIAGASYYTVWSSEDPYGTFSFLTNLGSEYTSFLDPSYTTAQKKFYRVTSNNGVVRRAQDFSHIPAKRAVNDRREAKTGIYRPEK